MVQLRVPEGAVVQAGDPAETSVALLPVTVGLEACGEMYVCARMPLVEADKYWDRRAPAALALIVAGIVTCMAKARREAACAAGVPLTATPGTEPLPPPHAQSAASTTKSATAKRR
jgi:hypothetical protein